MATAVSKQRQITDKRNAIISATIVIIVGIISTTLSQPQLLAKIPIQNLLKNELHVDRTANAAFFFWIGFPWYLKPIIGVITDAFPLFGSRRKSYILISTALCVLSWVGLYFTPHQYSKLLWVTLLIDAFMVIMSTVIGAYLVETAQANAGSGRLTAAREIAMYGSYLPSGALGGYLASVGFGLTIAACGGITFLLLPITLIFLYEQRRRVNAHELLGNAKRQLVKIGTAGTMWTAAGFMALFYIAPGQQTALFYRQQDFLHMDTRGQGMLLLTQGVGGVVAALLYGFLCKRINLRNLLFICLALGTAGGLAYLLYFSVPMAFVAEASWGFGFVMAECALCDLAVRATPKGSEGLGYSLMMSVRNFALFGTDMFGSMLMDKYHIKFTSLILANAATTAITIPLVVLLPLALIVGKDAEPLADAALPANAVQE
jgi:predicted MFS family arabinose efflux permease